ncbi:MAG: 2-C-methyl-D-erythritol 4-phosphate cytidylyltransferase [Bacillota bacterium]
MARIYAVVAAAGQSTRMGGVDKQLLLLAGIPVLVHSLRALEQATQVEGIVLVAPPDKLQQFREITVKWNLKKITAVVPGGVNRQQSVLFGLLAVPFECEVVLVHDGARPLVTVKEIEDLIPAAVEFGAATLAVPVKDTVKEAGPDGFVARTPDRKNLWLTLTPQGFSYNVLMPAHRLAGDRGAVYTDDASLVEASGHPVKIVRGSYSNIKITTAEDLYVAEALLGFRDVKKGRNTGDRRRETGEL